MAKALQAARYRPLPRKLREMREAAGLTQRDLARKLKIAHTLIHASEVAERRVDVMEFCDWCRACGVDPADTLRDLMARRGRT